MKIKLYCIAIIVTLLFFKTVSFAQAPDLATASSFALFTVNGAFTNSGVTVVTGDVGTNVGTFTGSPAATVIGQTRLPGSSQAAQAAIDVTAAYNFLTSATCGPAIGPILGNGQSISPGIYCQAAPAAASTLDGTLTLDGAGIYIIRLNGALTTTSGSFVRLINGASFNNVYWQINGAVNLGVNSLFRGTILANGAISLLTGASLEGRGLSIAGAISLGNNRVSSSVLAPLPVALVSFTAKAQENHTVSLAWTTSLETDNKGFLIERSKDLTVFEKVGVVDEIAANSKALKNYTLLDQTPYAGTSYYRLTQTDLSGRTTVYPSVSVVIRDEAYGAFPNPVVSDGRFTLRLDEPETATIGFYSLDGRSMSLQKTGVQAGNLQLKSTGKLSTGVYVLTVEERGQKRQHRLVVE